jgi:hypothetical protein
MKKLSALLPLLLVFYALFAQSPKNMVISLPVERFSKPLVNPWAGGMNDPQFSKMDLNGDGTMDLVAFDRIGDKIMPFLKTPGSTTDTGLIFAPQYEGYFPKTLQNWVVMRDYDNNGIPDIFTWRSTGMKVYKGTFNGTQIVYNLVSPLVVYDFGNFDVNIWVNVDDVPGLVDVNGDGDLDILTFGIAGCSVEYYENQTVEHAGDPAYVSDSLKFENYTLCWGNFCEDASTNALLCNFSCKGEGGTGGNTGGGLVIQVPGEGARHTGSTLYTLDYEDDNDIDLLLGDISFNNMVLALNSGDSSFANACAYDSIFPLCDVPVDLPVFPAAYGYDVNEDGLEDMLVSPNARGGARDVHNVLHYKKVPDPLCRYRYQTDSFMTGQILDFGTDAKPVFFDFNNDGKKDIVVGNYGYFRPFQTVMSDLALLDNIGSDTIPAFRVRSVDWQNLSQYNLVGISPAFGDLDGDGKADMVIGELNGFLHFFKNTGVSQASFPNMTQPNFFNMDAGQYSTPLLYDLNGDSLLDIVCGKRDGRINYYWNMGTTTAPVFHADSVNTTLGGINVTEPGFTEGFSFPSIYRDSAAQMHILVGNQRGNVYEYLIDTANLRSGTFTLLDTNVMKYDVGAKATVSVADINNDGYLEYMCGNGRGGVQMFSDSLWDTSTIQIIDTTGIMDINWGGMQLFPNPATNSFTCHIENADLDNAVVEVYNLLGERINLPYRILTNDIRFNTEGAARGLYLVKISNPGITRTGKVLIQ